MANQSVHTVPNHGNWAVKISGTQNSMSQHRTQAEANRIGRLIAQSMQTEHFIHRPMGKYETKIRIITNRFHHQVCFTNPSL